ncbi:cobyrinate a,c-diamide synthase [Desulfococcaceae bacterium HSG8]|nr:cobyrinate a,c-diamide synthase [Desulfococcaceae bacterium HSG8]
MRFPRLIISALRGGAGKTVLSIGMVSAWKQRGISVAPYKKGPDYIDAGWLALAAGRNCYNLDTFLIDQENILNSFLSHTSEGDIGVIEGNRGLYDGIDTEGITSTAELAKLLKCPVVLCIDCTKSTRTMAAAVLGCVKFDPDVRIEGVVLNRVAGSRHENVLRKNIEYHCGIPVVGAIPKLRKQSFPERHMGLVPTPEHQWAKDSIEAAAQMAEKYLDFDALERIVSRQSSVVSRQLPVVSGQLPVVSRQLPVVSGQSPVVSRQSSVAADNGQLTTDNGQLTKIGIIRDSAFQFYYPENIEAIIAAGAEVVWISALKDKSLPPVSGLYIGGGFPETHAEELAENSGFRKELKAAAESGLPIYAECGGLMYLGEELVLKGKTYPMTGVLPLVFGFCERPQGHGYTVVEVDRGNPYFKVGTEIRGHEFHYSEVLKWRGNDNDLVFSMKRGAGLINRRDGVCYKNILATYTHIHALGMPFWARNMIKCAEKWNGR